MQKYIGKTIIILILVMLLIGGSVFAVDQSVTIGDDLRFSEQFWGAIPSTDNLNPGDTVSHVTQIKNESEYQIGLYFATAREIIDEIPFLNQFIFSIYVDGFLYQKGTYSELSEKLIYVIEPGSEILLKVNITFNKNAGNTYQGKQFFIEWEIGIKEYTEPEPPPEPIDPDPIVPDPVDPKDPDDSYIIGPFQKNPPTQTLIGQIKGYIDEKLDHIIGAGYTDTLLRIILLAVALLVLIELGRGLWWLIIILANLRNTKIYVRVIEETDEKFKLLELDDDRKYKEEKFRLIKKDDGEYREEKFKLVKKIKTKDDKEITIDLDKLAEKYEIDDLKIIFSKRISKKIDKSKIIVNLKEQSLQYDVKYDEKPIELDVNI